MGTRLGPYAIDSAIGAGGMGEVYRARDTRLDRVVAIKIIGGAAAHDPTFRERFDREARAISALDHPNICTLYDVGHENGIDFLVLQFLEGETLADRLARGSRPKSDASSGSETVAGSTISKGPIPIEAALRYGVEIACALDAAHKRGIIHRDLKPGNIILTKAGTKLLDFGLAKLAEQPVVSGMGEFPTRMVPLTGTGSIVGTLNYMSPEQLEGGGVDARTDIFAFGAVLFEMLSGRRAFNAESHAGLIAAIIGEDAPALESTADTRTPLSSSLRRTLDRLLSKCLAKDPETRWQCAADLAAELRWINEERVRTAGAVDPGAIPAAGSTPLSKARERWWMAAAAVSLLAAAGIGSWTFLKPTARPSEIRFLVDPVEPIASGPGFLAVSPDGRQMATVVGARVDTAKLWVRSLDSLSFRPLAGTEGAFQPFWSPDGRSIGFSLRGRGEESLKRVPVGGGPITTLAAKSRGRAAWGSQGVILLQQDGRGLFQLPESGGTLSAVTQLDEAAGERSHDWPLFLPDGRRFLYLAQNRDRSKNAVYLASLDAPGRTRVLEATSSLEYGGGHLLYQRDGTLMAHPFDAKTGRVTGDARPIAESVAYNTINGRSAFSASISGDVLVYRAGAAVGQVNYLQWFDMMGRRTGTTGGEPARNRSFKVSHDGTRVAVSRADEEGRADIYVVDVARDVPMRLTSDPGDEVNPVWSPDDSRIIFASNRKNRFDLYQRSAGGAGADELLFSNDDDKWPVDVSPDGKLVLFVRNPRTPQADLWALPLTGDRKPFEVIASNFSESGGAFSPNGRWLAYSSDDLGSRQAYVQAMPATGQRVRLSTTTGTNAVWSADGRTVFYLTEEMAVMAIDVSESDGLLRAGVPRQLFLDEGLAMTGFRAVSFDRVKQRFLMLSAMRRVENVPLTVVLNWTAGLKK